MQDVQCIDNTLSSKTLVAKDQRDGCSSQHHHCGGYPQKGRAAYKAAANHFRNIFRIFDNRSLYVEVSTNTVTSIHYIAEDKIQ